MGIWDLITRWPLPASLDRRLLRRLLLRLHKQRQINDDHRCAIKRLYTRFDQTAGSQMLLQAATPEALVNWSALDADQETLLGHDALEILLMVSTQSDVHRRAVLRHLQRSLDETNPALRTASFKLLFEIDTGAAIGVALNEMDAGLVDLLGISLRISQLPDYQRLVDQLGSHVPTPDSSVQAYLLAEFETRSSTLATVALCALGKLDGAALPKLLARHQRNLRRRDPVDVLIQGYKNKDLRAYRSAIAAMLSDAVQHSDSAIWKPCLSALLEMDAEAALTAARARLAAGEIDPIEYLLNLAALPIYEAAIRALADAAGAARDLQRTRLIKCIFLQAMRRDRPYAGRALAALVTLHPAAAGLAFTRHRRHGVLPQLLECAAEGDHQRASVLAALGPGLGLPSALEQPSQPGEPQKSLAELLFPFVMPKAELSSQPASGQSSPSTASKRSPTDQAAQPKPEFHVEEALKAPETSVAGLRVTAWLYRQGDRISDMVVAGHATADICKVVTGKLISALIATGRSIDAGALLATGVFLLRVPPDAPEPDVLETLAAALRDLADQTGLVQVREASHPSYDAVVARLKDQIARGLRAGTPIILHRPEAAQPPPSSAQIEYEAEATEKAASSAVLLPFYLLEGNELQPLSIDLPLALFNPDMLHKLLATHETAISDQRAAEAQRRKRAYQTWLERDETQLRHYVAELFGRLLQHCDQTERAKLVERYCQRVLDANHLSALYEAARAALPSIELRPAGDLTQEQISQALQTLRRGLARPDALAYDQSALAEVHAWVRANNPQIDTPLADWYNTNIDATPPNDTMVWRRNYPEGIIELSADLAPEANSLLELIHITLPALIRLDNHWLAATEQQINKDDADQLARLKEINICTLIDPFLRGWPPVFLSDTERQTTYQAWMEAHREPVWEALRQAMIERGARVDPLTSDNVVFAAQQTSDTSIRITPYFVTSDRECAVLLHPQVGMTWYLYPWQYRECQHSPLPTDKRAACRQALACGEQALARAEPALARGEQAVDEIREAVAHFQRALRIHPVLAADELVIKGWATTHRDTRAELDARVRLAQAIERFHTGYELPAREVLEAFAKRYPMLVAESYLFQALLDDAQAAELALNGAKLRKALARRRQQIQDFEALQSLIRLKLGDQPDQNTLGKFIAKLQGYPDSIPESAEFSLSDDIYRTLLGADLLNPELPTDWMSDTLRYWLTAEASASANPNPVRKKPVLTAASHIAGLDVTVEGLEALAGQIRDLSQICRNMQQAIWHRLSDAGDQRLFQAIQLDHELDDLRFDGPYQPSRGFDRHLAPLLAYGRAGLFLQIVHTLRETAYEPLRGSQIDLQAQLLAAIDDGCDPSIAAALGRLAQLLQPEPGVELSQAEQADRSEMIRRVWQSTMVQLAIHANELLTQACKQMPESTEIRRQQAQIMFYMNFYQQGLQQLIGDGRMPLLNSLRAGRYQILDARRAEIAEIAFDTQTQTVSFLTATQERRPVLRFEGLTGDDLKYVSDELRKEYVVNLLNVSAAQQRPVYTLLLGLLTVPPRTESWCRALTCLAPLLVPAIAYLGPPTLEPAERKESLAEYDTTCVIEHVGVSLTAARDAVTSRLFGPAPAFQVFLPDACVPSGR